MNLFWSWVMLIAILVVVWVGSGSIFAGMRIAHARTKHQSEVDDLSTAIVVLMGPVGLFLVAIPLLWEGNGNPLTWLARWLGEKD